MEKEKTFAVPAPIIDEKEMEALDTLTQRYKKFIEPGHIAKLGKKVADITPEAVKNLGSSIKLSVTEKNIYKQSMEVVLFGFKKIEEQAAKFTITEEQVIKNLNKIIDEPQITDLEEVCLIRSYDLARVVNKNKSKNIVAAIIEGGGTGVFGFWGLPFNLVLSTFLYYRAVQAIAMYYGYDVRNDSAELVIASEVFSKALSPINSDINNETSNLIGKLMLMTQANVIKQTAGKTWTDMASRGGVTLLLTQMRALAHSTAQKALEKAGQKGLESSLFKDVFEQIGKKLTLKSIGKAVPYVSAFIGASIDTAQMSKVLDFADLFYQKRFIMEKEKRIAYLTTGDTIVDVVIAEE